ncbi:T9SS type A sorting domain-containing protein [uncultured Lacinutrix sp.]|uniref:T9SS type A sorting domain-containing protein n=1 Tax=uncultured Lacinutrix sp. TaxID=574032 RepID=UPI0026168AD7|nr:T9SS type A sorting domain-containing protein [uncultured Lacinutrix sp.]
MKKVLLFFLIMLSYVTVHAQCNQGDCQNVQVANGQQWSDSHGTPSWSNGSVWLWSYFSNFAQGITGEGVNYSGFNFVQGQQYCVSFNLAAATNTGQIPNANSSMNVVLTQNAVIGNTGTNVNNTIPPTPNPNQAIMGQNIWANGNNSQTYTFNFTASQNFNNIWFYPSNPSAPNPQIEVRISNLTICQPCVAQPTVITVDGTDVTDSLTYTIPCDTNCININATNIQNAVYNTSSPVFTNLNGLFCLPNGSTLTSFIANITGTDSCGDPYNENITINIEQDCCNDEPYIEPYWDFCDSYNVCELDEWPIRVLDAGNPLLLLDGYTFSWTLNGNVVGTSDALFGVQAGQEYEVTITYPNGCVYTLTYLKECCTDEVSVEFVECPQDVNNLREYSESQYDVVSQSDIEKAIAFYNEVSGNGEDCDPCDADVPVVYTNVLLNGAPITSFQSVVLSWAGNPGGVPINMSGFFVYTDVLYTVTVTILDPEGHECVYTYEFIYECETECEVTAPTNLQVVGNTLTWDPVPGAVGYIITSPGGNVPQIDCGCRGNNGVSIAPVTVSTNSYTLPASLSDKCFVWQVTAICEDESQSPISSQACYTPQVKEDCETTAPTNLQVSGSTLSWNPVPGALYYTISSPAGNVPQIDCGCKFGVSIAPISPIYTNSYTLPANLADRCFVWQVTAVCKNGEMSPVSSQACYGGDGDIKDVKEKVSIYPNPNNGVMDVKVEMDGRQEVTLSIHRFDGTLVKTIENSKITNGELNLNLNLKSSLQKGLYFFTFTSGDKTITKKVMIE